MTRRVNLTDTEIQYIKDNPHVGIALNKEYSPFSSLENDKPVGLDIDLLKEIEKRTGLKFLYSHNSWSDNLDKFRSGDVYMIADISHRPERESFTLFTDPYYEIPIAVSVRENFGSYTGLESLRGRKVGIVKDIFYAPFLRKITGLELIEFEKGADLVKNLNLGLVEAVVQAQSALYAHIQKNSYTGIVIVDELEFPDFSKEDLRFGINPDKPLLHSIISKALSSFSNNELDAIYEPWVGELQKYPLSETPIELTVNEQIFIRDHPEIVIGAGESFIPNIVKNDEGNYSGLDYDYIELINQKSGLNLRLEPGPWPEIVERAQSGELDGLAATIPNSERTGYFNFSNPYVFSTTAVYVKKGNPLNFGSEHDLENRTGAVVAGNLYPRKRLENVPGVTIREYDSGADLLRGIISGEADFVIESEAILYVAREFGLSQFIEEAFPYGDTLGIVFSLKKEWPELTSIINKAIAAITDEEEAVLYKKWLGREEYKSEIPGYNLNLTEKELEFISQGNEILIGTGDNIKPYAIKNADGSIQGHDPDLFRIIMERTGLNLRQVVGPWAEIVERAQSGELDGLNLSLKSDARSEYFDYTIPYLEGAFLVLVKKGNDQQIYGVKDLENKRVGIIRGYEYHKSLSEKIPGVQISYYSSNREILNALISGIIDFTIRDETILYAAMVEGMSNLISVAFSFDEHIEVVFSFTKEKPELTSIFNKVLQSITEREKLELKQRWSIYTDSGDAEKVESGTYFTNSEKKIIENRKEVVLGASTGFPPYIIENPDGSIIGIDADYLALIEEKTGLNIRLEVGPWKEVIDRAQKGELDGLSTTSPNEERLEHFNFSNPYMTSVDLVLVKRGNPSDISEISDLKGKRAAVETGNLYYEKMAEDMSAEIHFFDSMGDALKALISEEVDFLPYYNGIFYIAGQMGLNSFVTQKFLIGNPENIVFSLDKNQPELTEIFNKAISQITVAEHKAIRTRWIDTEEDETSALELSEEEKIYIADNPLITLGGSAAFEPFFIYENGQIEGIVRDICDIIEERTGMEIKVVLDEWSSMMERGINGEINGLGASSNAPYLKENFLLTDPYLRTADIVIVKRGNPLNISKTSHLAGKKGATIQGNQYHKDLLNTFNPGSVQYFDSTAEMLRALISESLDYVVMSESIFYTAGKEGFGNLIDLAIPLKTFADVSIALNKNEKILLNICNKALSSISFNEMRTISSYWLGGEGVQAGKDLKQIDLNDREKNYLQEHPTVRIGVGLEYPPFIMKNDNGTFSGILVELADLIWERSELEIEYVTDDWPTLVEKASQYKLDGLAPSLYSREREESFLFSSPFAAQTAAVIVKKGNPLNLYSLEDLRGKTLVTHTDTPGVNAISNLITDLKIIYAENNNELIQAILSGEADFTINYETLLFYAAGQGLDFLDIAFVMENPSYFVYALRKDRIELTSIISKSLDSIPGFKKMEIRNRWFNAYRGESEDTISVRLTDEEWEYLVQKGRLKMSVLPEYLPYSNIGEDGVYEGMVADIIQEISRRIDTPIDLVPTRSWLDSQNNMRKRIVDILPMAQKVPSRLEFMNFTSPYITEPYVVVTDSEELFVEGIEDLFGRKIGIMSGSSIKEALLLQAPDLQIIDVKSIEDGLKRVQSGELYAYIDILNHVGYYLQQQGIIGLKIAGRLDGHVELSIASRSDEPLLASIMEKAVNSITAEDFRKISANWYRISYEPGVDYTLIRRIITIAVIAVLVIFAWMLNLNREVRKRKAVEAELRTRQDLIDSVSDIAGIWFWTLDLHSMEYTFNDNGLRHLGTTAEQEGGNVISWDDFLNNMTDPADRQRVSDIFKEIEKHSDNYQDRFEYKLVRRDGYIRSVVVDVQILFDDLGNPLSARGSSVDISESKNRELHLVQAKQLAEAAARTKSDFLANMSHEIRTPMNGIMGMIHLVLRTELRENQRHYLESIENSAKSLLGILNDILDFSKIEAGKMSIEKVRFDLFDTIDNVLSVISFKTQEKGLELTTDYDCRLKRYYLGDPLRLSQILNNLLSNALKFTESGTISLVIRPVGEDQLHFEVKDTGIGMTPIQQSRLFKPFSQADGSTTRNFGGTGLGLAISKQLVELMNGTIRVDSQVQKGSTFSFDLNLVAQGEESACMDFSGKKALIVDDSSHYRQILSSYLNSCGIECDTAADGFQALDIIQNKEEELDLILMDWNMPGMDGIETTEKIFSFFAEIKIPVNGKTPVPPVIIMISAFGQEAIVNAAREAGISKLLPKPLNPLSLQGVLMQIFGSDDQQKQFNQNLLADSDSVEVSFSKLSNLKGARILLVEDNRTNRQIISGLLEGSGIVMEIAENGLEAVHRVKQNTYDLILMDIQMPVMDGFTATEEIRKMNISTPLIALSANVFKEQVDKAISSGADDHLAKPIEVEKFYAMLLKYIPTGKRSVTKRKVKEPEVEMTLPEFTTINTEKGLKHFAGNKALFISVLSDFAGAVQYPDPEKNSAEELHRHVHTLKGLSGNFGAEDLQQLCIDYEIEYDPLILAEITGKLESLVNEVKELLPVADQNEMNETDRRTAEHNEKISLFKQLETAFESQRPKQVQSAFEELRAIQLTEDEDILIGRIQDLAEGYNFDEAEKLLRDNIKED